jgi:hypothetical protein
MATTATLRIHLMKTAYWISAGVIVLTSSLSVAGDTPTTTISSVVGDPCASACDPWPSCDPCCPPKPAKVKKVCAAPQKIIVHQAQPIVEFRNDAAANVVAAPLRGRPVVEDRAIRPVGDFHHGGTDCACNGGGNFFKTKTKNYFQGVGTFGGASMPFAPQTSTVLAATPLTVQAFVPQTVQTVSVAAMPAVQSFGFAAPTAFSGFGVAPAGGFGVSGFNLAPQAVGGFGASAADLATIRALAEVFSSAGTPAAAAKAQSNGNGGVAAMSAMQASVDAKFTALDQKVQEIDARLRRLEAKLQVFCAP